MVQIKSYKSQACGIGPAPFGVAKMTCFLPLFPPSLRNFRHLRFPGSSVAIGIRKPNFCIWITLLQVLQLKWETVILNVQLGDLHDQDNLPWNRTAHPIIFTLQPSKPEAFKAPSLCCVVSFRCWLLKNFIAKHCERVAAEPSISIPSTKALIPQGSGLGSGPVRASSYQCPARNGPNLFARKFTATIFLHNLTQFPSKIWSSQFHDPRMWCFKKREDLLQMVAPATELKHIQMQPLWLSSTQSTLFGSSENTKSTPINCLSCFDSLYEQISCCIHV